MREWVRSSSFLESAPIQGVIVSATVNEGDLWSTELNTSRAHILCVKDIDIYGKTHKHVNRPVNQHARVLHSFALHFPLNDVTLQFCTLRKTRKENSVISAPSKTVTLHTFQNSGLCETSENEVKIDHQD